jgi:hypothetical protein
MSDYADAAADMHDDLQGDAGETVVLSNGVHSVTLSATIGRSPRQVEDASGIGFINVEFTDFIVKASALILDSVQVQPSPGMRITWGARTYTAQPPTPQEQCFRFCDQHRTLIRIHTVLQVE